MKLKPQLGIAEADRIGTAIGLDVGDDCDDPQKAQKLLYSRAEFLVEEAVKQPFKNEKLKPDTTSMLDLALTFKQEREAEIVGARRRPSYHKDSHQFDGAASPAKVSLLVVFSACKSALLESTDSLLGVNWHRPNKAGL